MASSTAAGARQLLHGKPIKFIRRPPFCPPWCPKSKCLNYCCNFGPTPEIVFGCGKADWNATTESKKKRLIHRWGKVPCCTFILGIFFWLGGATLIAWSEVAFSKKQALLGDVEANVVTAGCKPDSKNDGKLVYISCPITSIYDFGQDLAATPINNISEDALQGTFFRANAQIYQWKEENACDKAGGKATQRRKAKGTCTRTFAKGWAQDGVPNDSFFCKKDPQDGCKYPSGGLSVINNTGNIPGTLEINSTAKAYSVGIGRAGNGEYLLNEELIRNISTPTPVSLKPTYNDVLVPGKKTTVKGNRMFVMSGTTLVPEIGDVMIKFETSKYGRVGKDILTVVGKQVKFAQQKKNIEAWDSTDSGKVNWLFEGSRSLNEILESDQRANAARTVSLRCTAWLLFFIGQVFISGPLSKTPDLNFMAEYLADVIGVRLVFVNLLLATALSTLILGIVWMTASAKVGVVFLVSSLFLLACTVAFCLCFGSGQRAKRKQKLLDDAAAVEGYGAHLEEQPCQFEVSAQVQVLNPRNDSEWLDATIVEKLGGGNFIIAWDHNGLEHQTTEAEMRLWGLPEATEAARPTPVQGANLPEKEVRSKPRGFFR